MAADPRVSVGCGALLRRDGKLLMERRAGSHGAGLWSIPGGWVDYGETPEQAAIREVKEETGLTAIGPGVADVIHTIFSEPLMACTTWFIEFERVLGDPQIMEPEKSTNLVWVETSEIRNRPLFPPLEQYLNKHEAWWA